MEEFKNIDVSDNRVCKSHVYFAWHYEIYGIFASLGTGSVQPRFRSHVKSMGDFSLLQVMVIQII